MHLRIGVPVFFVLSGFVIYAPFVRARQHGGPRLRSYAIRRFMRIMPPYWAVLTVFGLVFGLRGVFTGDWWRHYSLTQVWSADTSQFGRGNGYFHSVGLPPAWTLSAEIAFYAFVPLVAFFVGRWVVRRRHGVALELGLLAALGLGSILLRRVGLSVLGPTWLGNHGYLFSTFPALFLWFVPGMALAVLAASPRTQLSRAPAWMASPLVCGSAAAAGFALLCLDVLPFDLDYPVTAGVAGLIVLPVVVRGSRGETTRALTRRPLVWLGGVSYSLYLVHYPIVRWLAAHGLSSLAALCIVGIAASLAAAYLAYVLVERPSHRLGRRWAARASRSSDNRAGSMRVRPSYAAGE